VSETEKKMAVARAVTVLAVATRPSTVFTGVAQTQRFLKFKPKCYSSTPSSSSSRKLILYSKPGCCLCDGLKEKLQSAFLLSAPHSLSDVDLHVSLSLSLSLLKVALLVNMNLRFLI
jgi:hypothetical protein